MWAKPSLDFVSRRANSISRSSNSAAARAQWRFSPAGKQKSKVTFASWSRSTRQFVALCALGRRLGHSVDRDLTGLSRLAMLDLLLDRVDGRRSQVGLATLATD